MPNDIGSVEQPDACPSLGYGNEAGTCPKHPNGQRFAFYDKDYGDLGWRCWEGENATRAAALRQAAEAMKAELEYECEDKSEGCGCCEAQADMRAAIAAIEALEVKP